MSQGQNNIFAFKIPDFKYGLKFSSEILENYTTSSYLNLDFIRQFSCHVVKLVSCRIKDLHNNFQACSSLYSAVNIHCKVVFRRKLKRSLGQKKAIKVLLMERVDIDIEEGPHPTLTMALWFWASGSNNIFLMPITWQFPFPKIHIHTSMHTHTRITSLCLVFMSRVSLFVTDQWNVNPGTALPNEKGVWLLVMPTT